MLMPLELKVYLQAHTDLKKLLQTLCNYSDWLSILAMTSKLTLK